MILEMEVAEAERVVTAEANPNLVTLDPKVRSRSPNRETLDMIVPKKGDHLGLDRDPRTKRDAYGMVLDAMMIAIPR